MTPGSGDGKIPHFFFVLLAIGVLAYLVLPGLQWGLPSKERNSLTLGEDPSAWRAPQIPTGEKESPWENYPNDLNGGRRRTGSQPRSAFNPVRSYHPDEYVFFKSLSGMRPSELRFFPGFFGWPALQIYVVGAALKVSSWLGLATLVPDMDFYFKKPEEMARLYEIGRGVTFLFAVGCILVIWRAAGRLFGAAAGDAAALLLAATPLFSMNARYLTADVPMLFWISLVLLFSTHIFSGGGRRWYVLSGIALGFAAATRYQGAAAAFFVAAAHWMRPADAQASAFAGATADKVAGKPAEGASACGTGALACASTAEGGCPTIPRRSFVSRDLWLAAAISIAVFLACNPYILARPGQFTQEFFGELRGSHCDWSQFAVVGPLAAMAGLGAMFIVAIFASSLLAAAQRGRAIFLVLVGFGFPAMFLLIGRPAMARYWMPVLLLPVLLVAWAFATVLRRGLELRKPGAKIVASGLLVFVLVFTAHQSLAFTRLFIDPAADTRTRAGEWIARNIPAGSSIGVVSEPWQFELPPLDARKCRIVVLDPSEEREPAATDYVVASDLQLGVDGASARWRAFLNGYDILQRFGAWPAGQKLPLQYGPQDMRYANPVIVIARRRA